MKLLTLLLLYSFTFVLSANAATYYVAVGGTGSNCTQYQTVGTASPTIAAAIACAGTVYTDQGAGDTVTVADGTYDENLINNIPNGSDNANRFILKSTNYRGATIRPPSLSAGQASIKIQGIVHYVTIDGFVIDGRSFQTGTHAQGSGMSCLFINQGGGDPQSNLHDVTIQNMEMKNCSNAVDLSGENHLFKGNYIHDTGFAAPSFDHACYCVTNTSTYEDNIFANGGNGYGLHMYDGGADHMTGNIIRRNKASGYGTAGFLVSGRNTQFYNNIAFNNTGGLDQMGIRVQYSIANSITIYSNVAYGNGGVGIYIAGTSVSVKNNISFGNAGTAIQDIGTSTTLDHNYCNSGCTGTGTINSTVNPFTNAAGGNFTLVAGSSAINAGALLGSPYNSDFVNVSRPQGAGYDMGAYEFASAPTCPAVSPALVASYDFEGNGNDASGNGRTATLGSGWTYTAGHAGQGALSNGTSGITVADHDSLDPCAAFTYEGWINLPNTSDGYAFINKNPDSKVYLFASIYGYCGSGVVVGGFGEGVNVTTCYTTPLTPGFKHIAVTYDSTLTNGNLKLYVNGNLVSQADSTALISATTGTLQFCTSSFDETCPSGTIVDSIRIYNYARSASEILSSVTAPPVYTIKLQVSSIKIGPSVSLKVGVP